MVDPELDGDDHRCAPRGEADQVVATGDRRQREGQRDRGELHNQLKPGQVVQPPNRERRAAV